ncbi:hypothetical protein TVAG_237130 [Trichomonas vaginalis G3]|uniref:Uncharacterized protein n=1 Tax=Trichomonas vaginalis (strain ATCC PRA-98 / G3) TaxID=412133 RepID=A2DCR3_TRIV3|nr:armadillo (ARM) repeat-containing protein family [Trichomonas vaginalis G3]EAY21687.1 hypothetical protein TVAG_237130 [Trichomonas vaginalis G3]KAI5524333.1 armadillo (ARM) repeat-containing protein family [Trichomonas vaginalis G3]|eukprot:XP_001582673.1 hypothetical protein [Trichomonas vaginalis G3]
MEDPSNDNHLEENNEINKESQDGASNRNDYSFFDNLVPFSPIEMASQIDYLISIFQDTLDEKPVTVIGILASISRVIRIHCNNLQLFEFLKSQTKFANILYEYFVLFNDQDVLVEVSRIYNYISNSNDLDLLQAYFQKNAIDLLIKRIIEPDDTFLLSTSLMQIPDNTLKEKAKYDIVMGLLATLSNLATSCMYEIEKMQYAIEIMLQYSLHSPKIIKPYVCQTLFGLCQYFYLYDKEHETFHEELYHQLQEHLQSLMNSDDIQIISIACNLYLLLINALKSTSIDDHMQEFIGLMGECIERLPDPNPLYYNSVWKDFVQNFLELLLVFNQLQDGPFFVGRILNWDLLWSKFHGWSDDCDVIFLEKMANLFSADKSPLQIENVFSKLLPLYDQVNTGSKIQIMKIIFSSFSELDNEQKEMLLDKEFLMSIEIISTSNADAALYYLNIFNLLLDYVMQSEELKIKYGEQFSDLSTIEDISEMAETDQKFEQHAILCEEILSKAGVDDD